MKSKRQSPRRLRSSLCQGPAARLRIQEFESSLGSQAVGSPGLFPGGVESPTFPRVRLACPGLCPAIFAISVRTGRVLGAGLWSPFFNFHFGGAETGSIAERDRFAPGFVAGATSQSDPLLLLDPGIAQRLGEA